MAEKKIQPATMSSSKATGYASAKHTGVHLLENMGEENVTDGGWYSVRCLVTLHPQ